MAHTPFIAEMVAAVTALPLHQSLGLALIDLDLPERGVTLPVDERTTNPSGVLHGGLVPLVLDVTAYLALLPSLERGASAATVGASCSLLRAVPAGGQVTAHATLDRLGRSTAFLSARLRHGDEVVATGQVVKAVRAPAS